MFVALACPDPSLFATRRLPPALTKLSCQTAAGGRIFTGQSTVLLADGSLGIAVRDDGTELNGSQSRVISLGSFDEGDAYGGFIRPSGASTWAASKAARSALYFHSSRGMFVVSDALDSLVAVVAALEGPLLLDAAYLANFAAYIPEPSIAPRPVRTAWRSISMVPPGHTMRVDAQGNVKIERHWKYFSASPSERSPSRIADAAMSAAQESLGQGSERVAVALGGLDSSIVVAVLARALGPERVVGIHLAHSVASSAAEAQYAKAVCQHSGVDYVAVDVQDAWSLSPGMGEAYREQAEPAQGYFRRQEEMLIAAAKDLGATCIATGSGADEVFNITLQFEHCIRHREWTHGKRRSTYQFLRALRDDPSRAGGIEALWARDRGIPPYLAPDIVSDANLVKGSGELLWDLQELEVDSVTGIRILNHEGTSRALGEARWFTSELYKPHGLSSWHPFEDPSVVEAAFSFPPGDLFFPIAIQKPLLRRAFGHLLPTEIVRRKHKVTFESMFDAGIGQQGGQRRYLEALFADSQLEAIGLAQAGAVNTFAQAYWETGIERTSTQQKYWFWRTICLELWLREWRKYYSGLDA